MKLSKITYDAFHLKMSQISPLGHNLAVEEIDASVQG